MRIKAITPTGTVHWAITADGKQGRLCCSARPKAAWKVGDDEDLDVTCKNCLRISEVGMAFEDAASDFLAASIMHARLQNAMKGAQ